MFVQSDPSCNLVFDYQMRTKERSWNLIPQTDTAKPNPTLMLIKYEIHRRPSLNH